VGEREFCHREIGFCEERKRKGSSRGRGKGNWGAVEKKRGKMDKRWCDWREGNKCGKGMKILGNDWKDVKAAASAKILGMDE
jgi:hypothetical protein